jgi:PAS domain S-box-containing protein
MSNKLTYKELQQRIKELETTEVKRKQLEDDLPLHSAIINRMTEGVYLIRLDGTIVYTNPRFEEMFGYEPGEMIGKSVSIVNFPTEKSPEETAKEILDILEKEGVWQGEIQNIKQDGTLFWCYASVIAFDHSKYGKVLVATHTDITERKRIDELLRKTTYDLGERVKELDCLYGISQLVEKPGICLSDIFQGTAYLIPLSWQYPDITSARIRLNDQIYQTENFSLTPWLQTQPIVVFGQKLGSIEVCYLEERPIIDKGAFLKEEQDLINAIAERLGRIVERKETEDEKERLIDELQGALAKVKTLSGFLPICASCKNIRDDEGYWNQIESYISKHSDVLFSHSICPVCVKKLYPDLVDEEENF